MHHLDTTICLNGGPDNFRGFDAHRASLRRVSSFDLKIDDQLSGAQLLTTALEIVFEQTNTPRPQRDWAIRYRLAGHRSLSVGDVVVIGETAWACAPIGWTPLTAAQLRGALER